MVLATFSSSWSSINLPGNVAFASASLLYADSTGYRFFFVGSDSHLYQILRSGDNVDFSTSSFGDGSIVSSGTYGGPPQITGFFDGSDDHVFYVGTDGKVHEYYGPPGGAWTGHSIGGPALQ